MADTALAALLRRLRYLHNAAADMSDGELLRRYIVNHDEAAFAALMRRHAPLVWGVCRRLLANEQDAEDAFQAVFVVLLRKSESLRVGPSLANWLHSVAVRIARKSRVTTLRRHFREARVEIPPPSDPFAVVEQRELRALIDEEMERLPEKYRLPLMLCYLQGLSYTETARQLGWRDGTVCGRLARARELLRKRLSRRGLTLSVTVLATLAEPATVPAATAAAVSRMAMLFALGQGTDSAAVSASVATLAQGALRAMTAAKLKALVLLVAVCCVIAGGGGLAAHRLLSAREPAPQHSPAPASKEPERTQTTQADHRDCHGDPLPPEAIARFGTTRFRHGHNVFDIAFTPDGTRVISADWYGAHLWETATGREIRRFGFRFQTSLRSLSLSPDGKTVALAEHRGGTIQILEVASGKLLHQFVNGPKHEDRFCSAVYSPDGKLLASQAGKTIRLWDPATAKLLRQWQADPESIHRIVFTPDSKTLISGGEDTTIRFWDTSTGKEVRRISDHPGPVTDLVLSPDGKTLASQGSRRHESNVPGGGKGILWLTDNKVHLWDAASGKKHRHLEAVGAVPKKDKPSLFHPNAILSCLFAPDGKTLVTSGNDRTIRFWDVNKGKELRRWEKLWVNPLAFSRDGKILATGMSSSVRLWDAATGRELDEQAGHSDGVRFLAASPDGRRVASASPDGTVRIWDAGNGRELHRLRSPDGEMAPIAFSADGRTLTTVGIDLTSGGGGKKGRVWDAVSGKESRQIPGWDKCSSFTVSTDGRTYAFVGKDKQVWLWDAVAERKTAMRIEHPKGILKLALSADARVLFGWCGDQKVHIWDAATGKELRQFAAGTGGETNCVAFSPDARWFAWAGRDLEIRLYDLDTGKEVRRFMAIHHFISCLAFAPDGRALAGASMNDPTIFLWETASGQVRHRLKGHEGRIFTLVFTADSKRLLSGSEDTTALLWNLIGASGERGRISAASLRASWDELASTDAETAYPALRKLTAAAGPTVDFLRKQLHPIPEPDPKRVAHLIADLDQDEFAQREKATKELENLGEAIEPALRTAHANATSAEMRRRTEALLAKLPDAKQRTPSATRLQMLRGIEVLERIDTAEAKQLLRKLANGAAGARQTREARAALERLRRAIP